MVCHLKNLCDDSPRAVSADERQQVDEILARKGTSDPSEGRILAREFNGLDDVISGLVSAGW